MPKDDIPIGQRFSHIYSDKGAPQKDSRRFRKRLGVFFYERFADDAHKVGTCIARELGVDVPVHGIGAYNIATFLTEADLRDVLDSITLIFKTLKESTPILAPSWLSFVERVFKEENLGYSIDQQCGVHYFIDEEFEKNRLSALSCLTDTRYSAVVTSFDDSHNKLDSQPPDTKGAVRSIFEALEILYKLIVDAEDKTRLNSHGVNNNLKPMMQKLYKGDNIAWKSAEYLLSGLCDWIDAAHMYRHGQKVEEPKSPPIGLAIQMISSGAAYLRWLVELDRITQK